MSRSMIKVVLAAALVYATGVSALAQETTTSTETKTFEVLAADGNQLIVSLPEGTRELIVPDDFRFVVNGQSLSVRQLKAGMKGTATITTRTTVKPVTITEVKNGIVVKRTRSTILVRTDDDVTKSFAQEDLDKRGLQVMRDGKPARVSDFREGDRLTATIITTKPPQVLTEREVQATLEVGTSGVAAPSAPVPPRATTAPEPPTRTLPKTASSWPLLGLASALLLGVGLGLSARRRFVG